MGGRTFTSRDGLSAKVHDGGPVPLLVVHGAVSRLACQPLARLPALADHHTVITYDRRGYGRSPRPVEPITIASQAQDALGVIEARGTGPVVVIGHSYGATIALELARLAPVAVQALVLIEPVFLDVPSAGAAADALARVGAEFRAGHREASLDAFLAAFHGPGCRDRLARALPKEWRAEALRDYDTYWAHELPAFAAWGFDETSARAMSKPVLLVGGELSHPAFHESRARLKAWLPNATSATLAGADHDMPASHPQPLAEAVCTFLGCGAAGRRSQGVASP